MDPPLAGVTVNLERHSCLEHSTCKWQEHVEDDLVVDDFSQGLALVSGVAAVKNLLVLLSSALDDVLPEQAVVLLSWVECPPRCSVLQSLAVLSVVDVAIHTGNLLLL